MKIGLFYLLVGSIFAGISVGLTATDSWFLAKVGAGSLPMVYLATPLVMVLYTSAATALCYYTSMTMVLLASLLGVGGMAALVGYLLLSPLELGNDFRFVFGVKLLANMWLYAAFTQLWNFIAGYVDINVGKSQFPRLNAAAAAGLMSGAAAVALLTQRLKLADFYFIWGGLCALSAVVTLAIAWKVAPLPMVPSPVIEEKRHQFKEFSALLLSRYGVMLAASAMLILTATVLCEWLSFRQFNADALEKARHSLLLGSPMTLIRDHANKTLQELLGKLGAASGALVLLFNLFIFSPLVKRIGVANTILIQPLLYASAFTAMALADGFESAAWALLVFQGFFVALDANTRSFLFNALPSSNRVVIRNCIEGMLEPTAAALAGAFLLWWAKPIVGDTSAEWLNSIFGLPHDWLEQMGGRTLDPKAISLISLIIAVGAFLVALVIRLLYPRTIADNFLAGTFNPTVPPIAPAAGLPPPAHVPAERLAASLQRRLPPCPALNDPVWRAILELDGPPGAALLFAVAPKLSALGSLQAAQRLENLGPIAVPLCMGILRDNKETMAAKLLAIEALSKISVYQLQIACGELLGLHFHRCALYGGWSQAAQFEGLHTVEAVAEKFKDAEVQVILSLLHHSGKIPDPALVGVALSSFDVKERTDMLETLSIAVENPAFLDLIVGAPCPAPASAPRLEELSGTGGEWLPEALAAAVVRDMPQWSAKWGPLSVVLDGEGHASEPGSWEKRLALASCPELRGAYWDAINVMAPEVARPGVTPRGLVITAEAGPRGPAGTCLNLGWFAGNPLPVAADGTRLLELSAEWMERLAQLCPTLPMQWLANQRQTGY